MQTVYTRNGAFSVNDDGFIVDSNGQFLLGYPVDTAGAVSDAEWQGMCKALNREDLIDDDAKEFADWLQSCDHYGDDYSVESNRYSDKGKIHVAWNNYKLWSLVHDTTMFNAEDNPAVTSLGMLEEIVLQDVIEKLS